MNEEDGKSDKSYLKEKKDIIITILIEWREKQTEAEREKLFFLLTNVT